MNASATYCLIEWVGCRAQEAASRSIIGRASFRRRRSAARTTRRAIAPLPASRRSRQQRPRTRRSSTRRPGSAATAGARRSKSLPRSSWGMADRCQRSSSPPRRAPHIAGWRQPSAPRTTNIGVRQTADHQCCVHHRRDNETADDINDRPAVREDSGKAASDPDHDEVASAVPLPPRGKIQRRSRWPPPSPSRLVHRLSWAPRAPSSHCRRGHSPPRHSHTNAAGLTGLLGARLNSNQLS